MLRSTADTRPPRCPQRPSPQRPAPRCPAPQLRAPRPRSPQRALRLLLVVVFPSVAASQTVCASAHDGDSASEGCYGWCMQAYQSDHCTYCKCKGCDFCKSGSTAAPIAIGPGITSGSSTSEASCQSNVEGDTTFKDCQPFCTAAYAHDHCPMCKCRACA